MRSKTKTSLADTARLHMNMDEIERLLGPAFTYFEEGIKGIAEKRAVNLSAILQRAQRKIGSNIQIPGGVPPRVFKEILSEGTYSDDSISLEYFAGILASSRTRDCFDDRGVRIFKTISRLSNFQLRGHFCLYMGFVNCYFRSGKNISNVQDRKAMPVYVQLSRFEAALNITKNEQASELLHHTMNGLLDDGLLDSWLMGSSDVLRSIFPNIPIEDGIIYKPSLAGAELFSAALGKGSESVNLLLEQKADVAAFHVNIQASRANVLSH